MLESEWEEAIGSDDLQGLHPWEIPGWELGVHPWFRKPQWSNGFTAIWLGPHDVFSRYMNPIWALHFDDDDLTNSLLIRISMSKLGRFLPWRSISWLFTPLCSVCYMLTQAGVFDCPSFFRVRLELHPSSKVGNNMEWSYDNPAMRCRGHWPLKWDAPQSIHFGSNSWHYSHDPATSQGFTFK